MCGRVHSAQAPIEGHVRGAAHENQAFTHYERCVHRGRRSGAQTRQRTRPSHGTRAAGVHFPKGIAAEEERARRVGSERGGIHASGDPREGSLRRTREPLAVHGAIAHAHAPIALASEEEGAPSTQGQGGVHAARRLQHGPSRAAVHALGRRPRGRRVVFARGRHGEHLAPFESKHNSILGRQERIHRGVATETEVLEGCDAGHEEDSGDVQGGRPRWRTPPPRSTNPHGVTHPAPSLISPRDKKEQRVVENC